MNSSMRIGKIVFLSVVFLFSQSCTKSGNPGIDSSQYKEISHGYWEAVGGDTSVTGEIGLIVYNWYAIDTKTDNDSVYVTWDDGIGCTKTNAMMKEDTIEMSVFGIETKFTIMNENEASVIFKTNLRSYEKQLLKLRNDPTVLCD